MNRKGSFSRDAYDSTRQKVHDAGGDTSYAGREKFSSTGRLDLLVDPAGYGVIRRSITRFVEKDDHLILGNGVAMLIETLGDTTGSMGGNVTLMFDSLPKLYELLTEGDRPVLGRYDPQILNGFFGDRVDSIPHYQRSQAEMAEKIAVQLTLMIPSEQGGANGGEDPQFGLFAAAYLTKAAINNYGLKSYHFLVTDETAHEFLDKQSLEHVFSSEVFDKVKENTEIAFSAKKLPSMSDIMSRLKSQAHAFAIVLPHPSQNTREYWTNLYGPEHVVQVDSTEYLPYIQAILIGLTEGVLDLEHVTEYLENHGVSKAEAKKIQRAVANIPFGAQTQFENFARIPERGSIFANKTDLWPAEQSETDSAGDSKKGTWL